MTKVSSRGDNSSRQIKRLSQLTDGIIYPRGKTPEKLSVWKEGRQLQLIFFSGVSTEVQARYNLDEPLFLVSPYTQAMMLGLVWRPVPKRVHIIGFGAGRLPMVLHRYLPYLIIDCTETDEDVVSLAQEFFGIELDAKLRVVFQDGRRFFEEVAPAIRYDMIMVDAFDGTGSSPFMLSTREFYESCTRQLTEDGVVVVNMLVSDELYASKAKTFLASFPDAWMVPISSWGGAVFFGSRKCVFSREDILQRARRLAAIHGFSFPFEAHARHILKPEDFSASINSDLEPQVLTD